jgi:hypothetical protein
MEPLEKICEGLVSLNDLWDKTPEAIKPVASGSAIILGLLLHKVVVGVGVLVFFGIRTAHKMEVFTKVVDEKKKLEELKNNSSPT